MEWCFPDGSWTVRLAGCAEPAGQVTAIKCNLSFSTSATASSLGGPSAGVAAATAGAVTSGFACGRRVFHVIATQPEQMAASQGAGDGLTRALRGADSKPDGEVDEQQRADAQTEAAVCVDHRVAELPASSSSSSPPPPPSAAAAAIAASPSACAPEVDEPAAEHEQDVEQLAG